MEHDLFREKDEVEEWLLVNDALQTGSRAWGTSTHDSDYDYVVTTDLADQLKTLLDPGHLVTSPHAYFENGYYLTSIQPGLAWTINIIAVPPPRVEVWKIATDMVKAAPCSRIPKNYIHILFMTIRTVLEKGGLQS